MKGLKNLGFDCLKWLLRIFFMLFAVLPIYACLIIALTPYGNLMEAQLFPKYWFFRNFIDSFGFICLKIFNSFLYSVFSVAAALAIALPSAYVLARYHFKGKRLILFGLLLTQMMAGIVILPSLYSMFSRFHLVNSRIGLVFVLMGVNLALVVWLLYGFFQTLPREVEEAAYIDGASFLGMFTRVILPMSMPGISVGAIFVFINTYNEFVIPLFLLTDAKLHTITLSLYTLLTDTTIRWHVMAGSALIALLPPVLIFIFFQKNIIHGLTSGAVKS